MKRVRVIGILMSLLVCSTLLTGCTFSIRLGNVENEPKDLIGADEALVGENDGFSSNKNDLYYDEADLDGGSGDNSGEVTSSTDEVVDYVNEDLARLDAMLIEYSSEFDALLNNSEMSVEDAYDQACDIYDKFDALSDDALVTGEAIGDLDLKSAHYNFSYAVIDYMSAISNYQSYLMTDGDESYINEVIAYLDDVKQGLANFRAELSEVASANGVEVTFDPQYQ